MSARLILFTRFPRPGEAKTRLIPTLGPEGAAQLHRELTAHTLGTVDQSTALHPMDVEIRYTGASVDEMSEWLGTRRTYADQGDGDLGNRMDRAADAAFESSMDRVVIIGADCPELSPSLLNRAFDLLISRDIVLGPALDGGYYLIGVRHTAWQRARKPLFADMPWGTDDVLTETLRRTHAAGLAVARLDFLGDVDRPADLVLWEWVRDGKR